MINFGRWFGLAGALGWDRTPPPRQAGTTVGTVPPLHLLGCTSSTTTFPQVAARSSLTTKPEGTMASPDRRRRTLEEQEDEARRTAASTSSGAAGQGEQPQQPRQQHQQQQQPQLQQQLLEQELAVQAGRLVDSFSQVERQAMMAALLRQQSEPAGQPAAGRGTDSFVGTSAGVVHGMSSATWPPQGLSAPYAPPGLGALGSTMGGSTTEPNGDSGFVSQARADQSASGSYVFGGRAGGPGGRHLLNSLTRGDRACQIRDRRGRPSQDRRDLPPPTGPVRR